MAESAGGEKKSHEASKAGDEGGSENTGPVPMDTSKPESPGGDGDKSAGKQSTSEKGEIHCYCEKPRDVKTVELQCGICMKYFHADCLSCYLGKCVPFMTNYQFFCKKCNPSKLESFNKKQASFSQMCHTAVANLMVQNSGRTHFSKDKEIIAYIDQNWEGLTNMPRRVKLTWHTTIAKTMIKDNDIFHTEDDKAADPHFGLVNTDLSRIGPNYDNFLKAAGAVLKSGEYKIGGFTSDTKSRSAKRKAPDGQTVANSKQKRGCPAHVSDVMGSTRMAPDRYPTEHPYNKDGYRYVLAEPDPHAPNRQAFDESIEWAGKPIPGYLYRTFLGRRVLLALHDRAPQLKISEDRLLVTGEKGYSMVRATHSVNRGAWYFEVVIEDMPGTDTATRIGWSQSLGNLQAPCGYDKFSYSWRSKKGTCFHQSKGKHYSNGGYKDKDVLGFYLYLPQPASAKKLLPPSSKDKPLVKFKSHLYFEEKDYVTEAEKNLQKATGSKIVFYKNGENQGVAWMDVFEGFYYPAISLYKNVTVTANFGPKFIHPPKDQGAFKAMSEAARDAVVEHALGDILYHIEHEGQLPEF